MSTGIDRALLARSTVSSALSFAVSFFVPLFLTPYVVWRTTLTSFGVWIALNNLALWLSQYDLGLGPALAKAVAERRVRGDREGLRILAATWGFYDLAVGALLAAAVVAGGRAVLDAVTPDVDAASVFPVLVACAVLAAITPILRHLNSTLAGLQRLDLSNRLSIWVTVLSAGGTVFLLESGWGILGLAVNSVTFVVLQIVAVAAMLGRLGHPLALLPGLFRAGELGALLGYGWKIQVSGILMLLFRSDRLILSAAGAPGAVVGAYQLGGRVAEGLSSGIGVLSSAVLPAASDLAARGDRERLKFLLVRGTRYHALAGAGLLGFAALFAPELMVLWMGAPVPDAAMVLRVMTLGGFSMAAFCCVHGIGVALGRAGWQTASLLLGVGASVLLYMGVGRRYDYVGLAGAVSIGLALVQIVFMIGFRRSLDFSWRELLGNALLRPAVLALPLAGVYAAWRVLAPSLPSVDGRPLAAAVAGSAFMLSAGLGWLAARAFRVLDDYDWDLLRSAFSRRPS
jgi:O-antigen/teichoic acid export membrane protein